MGEGVLLIEVGLPWRIDQWNDHGPRYEAKV
jgi:hypothetical protein